LAIWITKSQFLCGWQRFFYAALMIKASVFALRAANIAVTVLRAVSLIVNKGTRPVIWFSLPAFWVDQACGRYIPSSHHEQHRLGGAWSHAIGSGADRPNGPRPLVFPR
jgi:hypothetical protein